MNTVDAGTAKAPTSHTSTEHSTSEIGEAPQVPAVVDADLTATDMSRRQISATTNMENVELFHASFLSAVRHAEIELVIQRERRALTPDVEYQEG